MKILDGAHCLCTPFLCTSGLTDNSLAGPAVLPAWTRTLHASQAPTALRGQVGRWAGELVGVVGAG